MPRFFCNTPEPGAFVQGVGFFHRGDVFDLDDSTKVSRTFAPLDSEAVALCKAAGINVGIGEVGVFSDGVEGDRHVYKQIGKQKVAALDATPDVQVIDEPQTISQMAGTAPRRANDMKL
jgi:hypothetical protein